MPAWWAARAAAVGLDGRWLDVTRAVDIDHAVCASLPDAPAGSGGFTAEHLGRAYTSALPAAVRTRHGRHYTPTDLAGRVWAMARRALGWDEVNHCLPGLVWDPACGAGALLVPALREHLAAARAADPALTVAGLPSVIGGVDTDPAAVWLANVVLAAEALPALAAVPPGRRRSLPALVAVGDGLARSPRPARAVLMNPPYGRVRLDEVERRRFATYLYGHANLYGLFLAAGLEALDAEGVLTALVPTSFTAGRYFANLRAELARSAPLSGITFVAARGGVFSGVLQETCIAAFSRGARTVAVARCNGAIDEVATMRSPTAGGPWLLPRRRVDARVAEAARRMPLTLSHAGWKVSTGPLVWNRRRVDLHEGPGPDRLPVLWAADVDGGRLHQDPARDTLRYLQTRDDADRAVLTLDEPAILVQRTTAPEQARRIVAVELTAADLARWGGRLVVENHVNVLRPRTATPALDQTTLARVLSSPTIDRLVRCLAGSVAVSAYELESLPLPSEDVLAGWNGLEQAALDAAVTTAYEVPPA